MDNTEKKKFANCTVQGTTLVYAHRRVNYLLFLQRLPTKTGGIAIKLVCVTCTHNGSATVS